MFAGIEPPRSWENFGVMLWPDGRFVCLMPRRINRSMSLLYFWRTRELSALGNLDGDNQKMYSTESLTRIRRTFTHSAGAGILAGLYQKNSWHNSKPN